jgi:hypothetical protein
MKINVGRSEKKFVESLKKLLKELPTCDHEDRRGCDSFDTARGDHLCFNKATVRRTTEGGRFGKTIRHYCDIHRERGDEDLPHAIAYRRLLAVVGGRLSD